MNKKYFVFSTDEFSDIVSEAIANIYYERQKNDKSFSIPYDVIRVAIEAASIAGYKMLEKSTGL